MAKKTTGLEVKGGPVTAVEEAEEALGMTVAEAAAAGGRSVQTLQTGPVSKSDSVAAAVATRQAAMAASTGIQANETINEAAAAAAAEAATEGTTIEEVIDLRETMVTEAMTTGYYDRLDERLGEQRIEYLYGFAFDDNELPNPHAPYWAALTEGAIADLLASNVKEVLCRMTELTKTAASQAEVEATGIQADSYSYDMVAYDSLFLMTNEEYTDYATELAEAAIATAAAAAQAAYDEGYADGYAGAESTGGPYEYTEEYEDGYNAGEAAAIEADKSWQLNDEVHITYGKYWNAEDEVYALIEAVGTSLRGFSGQYNSGWHEETSTESSGWEGLWSEAQNGDLYPGAFNEYEFGPFTDMIKQINEYMLYGNVDRQVRKNNYGWTENSDGSTPFIQLFRFSPGMYDEDRAKLGRQTYDGYIYNLSLIHI